MEVAMTGADTSATDIRNAHLPEGICQLPAALAHPSVNEAALRSATCSDQCEMLERDSSAGEVVMDSRSAHEVRSGPDEG